MTLQFSVPARNARLEGLAAAIGNSPTVQFWTGVIPTTTAGTPSGTKLVEIPLGANWSTAAANGIKALANTPLSAVAIASGVASYFRFMDAGGQCHIQGSITADGGSGDFQIDNPNITVGQTVQISSWAMTEPGA